MRFSTTLSGLHSAQLPAARNPTCSLSTGRCCSSPAAFSTYRLSPVLPEAGSPEPVETVPWGEQNAWWTLGMRIALLLFLLIAPPLSSRAAVREVTSIGLTVGNLDRELDFYTKVLPLNLCRERRPRWGCRRVVCSAQYGDSDRGVEAGRGARDPHTDLTNKAAVLKTHKATITGSSISRCGAGYG